MQIKYFCFENHLLKLCTFNGWVWSTFETDSDIINTFETILRQENIWKKDGEKTEKCQKSLDLGSGKKKMENSFGIITQICHLPWKSVESFQTVRCGKCLEKSLNQDCKSIDQDFDHSSFKTVFQKYFTAVTIIAPW